MNNLGLSETTQEKPCIAPRPDFAAATALDREISPLPGSRPLVATVCGLLCLAVLLVFCQTGGYDFVNYDDDHYVYDNEHINRGLTWEGLAYYACHWHAYTYHPLSTYSHMLDCQLFGVAAGGHHWVNVVLHAVTAVLLLLLLRQMTGRLWPSALAAAVFAIHPLHVQSVAWISERKDVLSGLFFVLTLGAYFRYVRGATARRYAIVCLFYVLGLLAKPMLVTLPLVLLLLDYWPLRRWQAPWHLLSEKVPLLLLALADSALTVHTQVNAIQSLESVSLPARITNTLAAYVGYLRCSFWPQGLAVFYPHPREFVLTMALRAGAIIAIISAAAFFCRRQAPYLLVGWLWFLGMLVPVIGLLQVGGQSMADRYTYLPQIGLALGLVWAAADLTNFLAARVGAAMGRAACSLRALVAAAVVAALAAAAWQQAGYWRDSESLWIRDDTIYPNLIARYNLGLALATAHRHEEAIREFEEAYKLNATDEDTLYAYAQSLEVLGRLEDAKAKYRATLAVNPKHVNANDCLARILLRQDKDREALVCWRHALQEDPKNLAIGSQIAGLLATSPDASVRDGKQAVHVARRMVEVSKGKDAAALDALAAAEAENGDFAMAVEHAQTALDLAAAGGKEKLAGEIRTRLANYEEGKPYRRKSEIRDPASRAPRKSETNSKYKIGMIETVSAL